MKVWKPSAGISLARFWRAHDRQAGAGDPLASTYHWFTEGSDNPDLKEGRSSSTHVGNVGPLWVVRPFALSLCSGSQFPVPARTLARRMYLCKLTLPPSRPPPAKRCAAD
jgi:hypothetical protein